MPYSRAYIDQWGDLIQPGVFIHQVTFRENRVIGQNSWGEDVIQPVDVVTLRGQVKQLAGRELEAARQVWAEARYQITTHYYEGLTPAMRILWNGQTLDVLDIQDQAGTRRMLTIIAKDYVA